MRRADERGFALLLIFLLASMIAIGLYLEMPRVALESQRQKEQLLIDRGEQYKRAIQLYFKKTGRYPAEIKDLENSIGQRFLRHRYVDPMTGKEEWRLIHVQGGMLTDSLVTKPKTPGDPKDGSTTAGQYVGVQAGLGEAPAGPQTGGISARDRRRPSEGGIPLPGADGQFNPGQPQAPGAPGYPNVNPDPNAPANDGTVPPGQTNPVNGNPPLPGGFPGQQPGMPVPFPGQQPIPGQSPYMGQNPGQTGSPVPQPPNQGGGSGGYVGAQPYVGSSGPYVGGGAAQGSNPGYGLPGGTAYPGQPGPPVNSQTGGVSPYQTQGNFGSGPAYPQPGTTTGAQNPQGPGTAADMINRILTTPRPGGMPGSGPTFGGGLAGVASTSEGQGVKIYNERTLYKEWEFIFDPMKVKPIMNPNGSMGVPAGSPVNQAPLQGGAPGAPVSPSTLSSPFGGTSMPGVGTPPRQQ